MRHTWDHDGRILARIHPPPPPARSLLALVVRFCRAPLLPLGPPLPPSPRALVWHGAEGVCVRERERGRERKSERERKRERE